MNGQRCRKILAVVGARPNLVKIAPILRAIERPGAAPNGVSLTSALVHTGQHYDDNLSAELFADLRIRPPDHHLGVGSGSHAWMTAEVMRRLEPVLLAERPDVALVVGDVDSTAASALAAAKLGVPVAHVEAGLRSFERRMPEEINRIITDALSDFLFTSEDSANENLRREGCSPERIFFVGNVMADSLLWALPLAESSTILDRLGIDRSQAFALLTLHRPGNVDTPTRLRSLLQAAAEVARDLPVVFPVHPRTRARIAEFGLTGYLHESPHQHEGSPAPQRIWMTAPLGYLDCIHLLSRARVVLTDSGGLQDETTTLGVPCLTLRERTERPVTVTAGTNRLVGGDPECIVASVRQVLQVSTTGERRAPPLWDGHAAERIVGVLAERL